MYGFGKEYKELDMRHLIRFRKAYERVKLCPIYRKVCNMFRRDMISELTDMWKYEYDHEEYICYNLSGCDYTKTDKYWIMRAQLTTRRIIRVVGESSQFDAWSRILPKAGSNTPIERYRKYEEEESDSEHDNAESESDDDYNIDDSFSFLPHYVYCYELYD